MNRLNPGQGWGLLVLLTGLVSAPAALGDALSAVQTLREGGCGGIVPAARPLRHEVLLDRAAWQWAEGRALAAAAESNGYASGSAAGVHVSGPDSSILQLLIRSGCGALTSRSLRDIGVYRQGTDVWLVMAGVVSTRPVAPAAARTVAPPRAPPTTHTASSAARALQLVNDVRAHGARCGERSFPPAPPMTLSAALEGVALGHAADMAGNNYFAHENLAGQSPADRVRAVGYPERLVGENIAYGPASVEETVQGWLDSPGHCENIMDPRFAEMGLGYAAGQAARRGLYWVQLLASQK
jgi:uncharacterized protein YkwD